MFEKLEEIEEVVKRCSKCNLCKNRTNIVFGTGNENADVMFIGEGPGADEDREGIPFVGKAGKLMNQAFLGIGISREDVYIGNIVKCRPPQNRNPENDEAVACMDYLRSQVMLVKPKIIVLLGSVALKNILGNEYGITASRGKWIVLLGNTALKNILGEQYGITASRGKWIEKKGIKYLPTFHPAALLRDESKKIDFWNDLKLVKQEMSNL